MDEQNPVITDSEAWLGLQCPRLGVEETVCALKDNEKGIIDQYKQLPPLRIVHTRDALAPAGTEVLEPHKVLLSGGANHTLTVIRPQTLRA